MAPDDSPSEARMMEVGALVGPAFAAIGAGGTPAGGAAPNPAMAGVPVARLSAPADCAPGPWHLSGSIAIAHYFMQRPPSSFYAKLPDYIDIGAPWLPNKSSTRSLLL